MSKRITIQLIGSLSRKEDVRLKDFIDKLNSVKKALLETEIAISGQNEPVLDYKLVDLRHSSPYTVVLEAVSLNGAVPPGLIPDVVNNFGAELKRIKREGKLVIEPDLARLQAYQDIGVIEPGRIEKVKITSGRNTVTLDRQFNERLHEIVGPDEHAHGTISGMLEAINFHDTNRFTIYPPIGPKKVVGHFQPQLRPLVKEAIGSFVTVIGTLRYKAWSAFPHGVFAEVIDIHEPESKLPALSKMRGAFAGSTGKLNSAEFVDQLRISEDR